MTKPLEDTEFWNLVMRDIYGPREGGVIIVIDAENARKGVAKTSCAVSIGDRFAWEFGYGLKAPDDGVLSAGAIFDRYAEHPGEDQPSVLIWDEAVGAGSGDARRHMTEDNVVLGRAWQVLRTRRIVTITTLPNWGDLDSRLQRFADYRLWCREWPIGEFEAYKVGTDFDGERVETEALGEGDPTTIRFPDASSDFGHVGENHSPMHPLYQSLAERKGELMATDTFDADQLRDTAETDGGIDPELKEAVEDEAKREQAIKTAIRACQPWEDDEGLSYNEAAELIDYSHDWVGRRVREWRDDYEHRDLVEDPRPSAQ